MVLTCTTSHLLTNTRGVLPLCDSPAPRPEAVAVKRDKCTTPQKNISLICTPVEKGLSHPLFCSPSRAEIFERHAAAVIKALSFRGVMESAASREGSIMAMHLFLRGELGVEPTHAQVQELCIQLWDHTEQHRNVSDLAWAIFDPIGVNRPIYQIYTRELVDQLASYIQKLGEQLPCAPRVVEIAAGDGRLSRALRKRGIRITATDLQRPGEWDIDYPSDVRKRHGLEAALNADIILASWLPLVDADAMTELNPLDVQVAQELLHCPHKTLIMIHAHRDAAKRLRITNSDAFVNFTDGQRFQFQVPDELNFTPEYKRLPQSRTRFPGTLAGGYSEDEGSSVVVYRARSGLPLPGIRRTSPEIERIREEAQRDPYTVTDKSYPEYERRPYLISDRYPILMDE